MAGAEWSAQELERIDSAEELRIAVRGADGSLRGPVPIWVVRSGGQVYVRTWYRRDTGWFGRALESRRARIDVPGLAVDVVVEDVGDGGVRAQVDAAYRDKYGHYGPGSVEQMVSDEAVATTLRLDPDGRTAG